MEAYWLTNFPSSQVGVGALFRMAKSRWEIENEGFNEAESRHGLEHICHHHAKSLLLCWLLTILALTVERLYRLRYLRRGAHSPQWCGTVPHSVGQSFSSRPCRYQLKRPWNPRLGPCN